MTDFASEFRKVFGNSCPPQTDWNQPRYFDSLNNDCYGSEAALMASLASEAYNKYCKKGGILAENSGYLISYLNEGRYDKLEDKIMAVVNAKIRQRIDAAKTKLKTEAFNKKFGK